MLKHFVKTFNQNVKLIQEFEDGWRQFINNLNQYSVITVDSVINPKCVKLKSSEIYISDFISNMFLFAVPKHRKSVEKRLTKKLGENKIIRPRKDLLICNTCGNYYEAGRLCPACYKRIIDETKIMQEAIQKKLQLDPVDRNVIVLYEGEEKDDTENTEFVEIPKTRPSWFSKNLMQKTIQSSNQKEMLKPSSKLDAIVNSDKN